MLIQILISCFAHSQDVFQNNSKSLISKLREGDSICYYQCHVELANQQLVTASGQSISSSGKNVSVNEKFVIRRTPQAYTIKHYCSGLNLLPNRRFSGLKFREKPYWEFRVAGTKELDSTELMLLEKLEDKGRDATEYDYAVTLQSSNQVIILYGNKVKQFTLPKGLLLSDIMRRPNGKANSNDRR